ncbi:hypothetical protein BDK51DRAFT_28011 [Blyttiomyces helicus]|uniref:HNH nuclease domain-containing protein n=1 Tax=Blyttiomyces helicus TaxID=388810 RepID=A0A4P9W4X3_9FUNG|nr:hypothetical protein BDK51DRAFT_28011 [Blyttiomyces helicus]|eukprot:RKO87419.1 hypothetical protein BDK51DRAFT_28011 [Blyttiomyces helicus]
MDDPQPNFWTTLPASAQPLEGELRGTLEDYEDNPTRASQCIRHMCCSGQTPAGTPKQASPHGTPPGTPSRFHPFGKSSTPKDTRALFPYRAVFTTGSGVLRGATFPRELVTREGGVCPITGLPEADSDDEEDTRDGAVMQGAHIFPFGLGLYVNHLSRLTYPPEFYRLMKSGDEINNVWNGIYMSTGLHYGAYGKFWWLRYQGGNYVVVKPRPFSGVPPNGTVITFNNPPPNPLLINLHAMFSELKRALKKAGWKMRAAGYGGQAPLR